MPRMPSTGVWIGDTHSIGIASRSEVEARVIDLFSQDNCPAPIINNIIMHASVPELNEIASLSRLNHHFKQAQCRNNGDTVYDGYEIHILVDAEHRRFIHIVTMDTLPSCDTDDELEQQTRVGWMLDNQHMRRNVREIVLTQPPSVIREISRCPRLNRIQGTRSDCLQNGDYIFNPEESMLCILVDDIVHTFVNITLEEETEHIVSLNDDMLRILIQRRIDNLPQSISVENDDVADVSSTQNVGTVTSTFTAPHGQAYFSSDIMGCVVDEKKYNESEEKQIKVANIIKDSMLVELQLDYNESNDTFELYTIDETTDTKVLILKGHGKDKYDLLKEHFEL
jgi:hypothetical protein